MKKCILVFFVCFALVSAADEDMLLEDESLNGYESREAGFDVAMRLRDAAIAHYYKNKKSLLALHAEPLFVPEKDYHIKKEIFKQGLPVDQVRTCGEMLFVQRPVEGILRSVVTAYDQKGREIGELAGMQIRFIEGNRVDFLRRCYWQELWCVQNECITKVDDPQESDDFYKKHSPTARFYKDEIKRVVQTFLPDQFKDAVVCAVHDSEPLIVLQQSSKIGICNLERGVFDSLSLPDHAKYVLDSVLFKKYFVAYVNNEKSKEYFLTGNRRYDAKNIYLLNLQTYKTFQVPNLYTEFQESNSGEYLIQLEQEPDYTTVCVFDKNFIPRLNVTIHSSLFSRLLDSVTMSQNERFIAIASSGNVFDIFGLKNNGVFELVTQIPVQAGDRGVFEGNFFCIKTEFRNFKIFNFNNVVMPQNDEELDPATLALKIV